MTSFLQLIYSSSSSEFLKSSIKANGKKKVGSLEYTTLGIHSCNYEKNEEENQSWHIFRICVNLKSHDCSTNPMTQMGGRNIPHVGHWIGRVFLEFCIWSLASWGEPVYSFTGGDLLLATVGVALSHPSVSSSLWLAFKYTVAAHTRCSLSFQSIPTHIQPVSLFRRSFILFWGIFLWPFLSSSFWKYAQI